MGAPQDFRQRYIAFAVEEGFSEERLEGILTDFREELSFSHPPRLVFYDSESNEGLVRCGHLQVPILKNALENLSEPNVKVRGVSGTIRKARQKFLSL